MKISVDKNEIVCYTYYIGLRSVTKHFEPKKINRIIRNKVKISVDKIEIVCYTYNINS